MIDNNANSEGVSFSGKLRHLTIYQIYTAIVTMGIKVPLLQPPDRHTWQRIISSTGEEEIPSSSRHGQNKRHPCRVD